MAAPTPISIWEVERRLREQYPAVEHGQISAILIDAMRSVTLFGLTYGEVLEMTEKVAVEQVKQIVGESDAKAAPRLDPEQRQRR